MTTRDGHRGAKLNILYVAHCLPYPPDKGERIRVFHQIRELTREHRVHLICGVEGCVAGVEALERMCASLKMVPIGRIAARLREARAFVIGKPRSVMSHNPAALSRTVARTLRSEPFDAILASTIGVAESVRHLDSIPKFLDFMDVTSELWKEGARHRRFPLSWLHRLEARRLAGYEAAVAQCFESVLFVSETEAELFQSIAPDAPISVVGNGVDLDAFAPSPASASSRSDVVFTGSMNYFPNIDAVRYFCGAILPEVHKSVPTVRFTIVGRRPTRSVRRLGREERISVTGFVSDVRPYLRGAAVAAAPFRISRGIQNKILEAMACGAPVVGTSPVLDALEIGDEDGARRADDSASFAREVIALLRDREWRASCSRRARGFVERLHRWDMHGPGRLIEAVVAGQRPSIGRGCHER